MATLEELAKLVGGEVVGDPGLEIDRLDSLDRAVEGEITFLTNPKFLPALEQTRASAVIVAPGVEASGKNLLVCANPYLAFAKILTRLQVKRPEAKGVLPGAHVAQSALLDEAVTVHPGAVVGERVKVGRGSILYPGVVLYDDVTVGEECILHAGCIVREGCHLGRRVILQPSAIIGGDGFGFAPDGEGYFKIPQVGNVVLEDDVEVGACACIDRAALGTTRIGRGTKIDNLVQVAHNVEVGENTILVSQVGIAGSTRIGKHCTFGGQSAAAGHLKVGDNVTIAARGGVTNDVEDGKFMAGLPLQPHKEWLRASMSFARLPEMRKEIQRLKRQIEELEEMQKGG